jgi:hypothetical protein
VLSLLVAACVPARTVTGCATRPYSVKIDPRFTAEERREILQAFDEWARFSSGHAFFFESPDGQVEIVREGNEAEAVKADENMRVVYSLGHTRQLVLGARVTLNAERIADTVPGRFRQIAMHELGHVLGVKHTGSSSQIMSAEYTADAERFGDGDLRVCRDAGVCP